MKIKTFTIEFLNENKKKLLLLYGKTADTKFGYAILPILWMILFYIAPLLVIFKISFAESVLQAPPYSQVFSWIGEHLFKIEVNFNNYIAVIQDSYYITAFINSLILAVFTTIICLFVGFTMAYGICCTEERTRSILLLLVSISFWTSFLIRIYSWINLLSVHGLVNSTLIKFKIIDAPIHFLGNYYAVCLGLVFCYLPFMIFPVYAVLEKLDKSYIEVAYDLGSRPSKAFWEITVPLSKQGIFAGCILVFATSIGEFVVPELLGGPDTITFGRVLWTEFFNNMDWPMACALSIVMMAFIIVPAFIFQRRSKI
jgi:putrescine transport system permease protein